VVDERLTVACADGAVRLTELQRAGGRAVTAEEFLRGTKIEKGMRLS
jgi:methionyl-tRNA formyltransferase